MEDNNNYFKKYFEQNQSDLNRYYRLGESDGKTEIPTTDSKSMSQTEMEILNDAENTWLRYKNSNQEQLHKIETEIDKTKKETNSLNFKTIIELNVYEKILNLIKLAEEKFFSVHEKINQLDTKHKFDFNFPVKNEPIIKETFIKRISTNGIAFILKKEMFDLRSIIDQSQSFKYLIHKSSNSQKPGIRRNILEEED